jgi:beta-lactamase class A
VNEEEKFFPASLLKVPVMMAYYHLAETDPNILGRTIRFETPINSDVTPTIIPRESLMIGNEYTVSELINRMITYSDNQAIYLLSSHLPQEILEDLFKMLGISNEVLHDTEGKLTVKEYAGFFRIMFNSSYLSREYSEKALFLLTSTDFNDALVAGVPKTVQVAHKFGEAGTGNIERQLHDCGIVYFPNHPYLACIMTRGKDMETLKKSITDISRFIYEKIDEQY